jgi:hypothetical protein
MSTRHSWARARDCGWHESSRSTSALPTRGCSGLGEMNEADGARDRDDGSGAKPPGGWGIGRQRQVRSWSGTAGGAEHAMLAMWGTSGMVVVRSLHGVHAHGVCGWRLTMGEHVGGKALPADLDREGPVACRHEPRGNERPQRKRDQHDAGQERPAATLAEAQPASPTGLFFDGWPYPQFAGT